MNTIESKSVQQQGRELIKIGTALTASHLPKMPQRHRKFQICTFVKISGFNYRKQVISDSPTNPEVADGRFIARCLRPYHQETIF